jgi:hypothetical protein
MRGVKTMLDPVLEAIFRAKHGEPDDEPLTAEDRQALKEGHEALARGEEVPDDDLAV